MSEIEVTDMLSPEKGLQSQPILPLLRVHKNYHPQMFLGITQRRLGITQRRLELPAPYAFPKKGISTFHRYTRTT